MFLFDKVVQDDKWSSLNEHLSTNGGQKTHTGGAEPLNTSIKTPEVLRQGGANVVSIPSGSTHWNLSHLSPVIMFQALACFRCFGPEIPGNLTSVTSRFVIS